jgi:hypothetical protein
MKILVVGISGFIGRELARELVATGHTVTGLSRSPEKAKALSGPGVEIRAWDGLSVDSLVPLLEGMDGVVNLAGENIAAGPWTKSRKQQLAGSRVGTGRALADALLQISDKPAFLVQGSGIGFYGPNPSGTVDEESGPGKGFLADLVSRWESVVAPVAEAGIRTVIIRSGIVLGNSGGMIPKLLRPFHFYAGAVPGSGRQWISWIHIRDHVAALRYLAESPTSSGPFNLVTDAPVSMGDLVRKISDETGRPAWLKIPPILLRAGMGEMARETILASQHVRPARLQEKGFTFRYPEIGQAIHDLLSHSTP